MKKSRKKKSNQIKYNKYIYFFFAILLISLAFYCFYGNSYKPPLLYGPDHPIKTRAPSTKKKPYGIYQHLGESSFGSTVERLLPPQEVPQLETAEAPPEEKNVPPHPAPKAHHDIMSLADAIDILIQQDGTKGMAPAPKSSKITQKNAPPKTQKIYKCQIGSLYTSFQQAQEGWNLFKKKCPFLMKQNAFFQKCQEKNQTLYRLILKDISVEKLSLYKKNFQQYHVPFKIYYE